MRERQKQILKAVVKEYQKTGLPVASQFLSEEYDFDFSPATVRAEMLALDKDGFLEQPHTSAGRLPTDKAFRLFIEELEEEIEQYSRREIYDAMEEFRALAFKEAAQTLADFSRSLGICGIFDPVKDFHEAGFRWLADEPEFNEGKIREVLRWLDSSPEEDFENLAREMEDEISVFIGRENPIKNLRNCSLMMASFDLDGRRGIFGILGPKRMDYKRNEALLKEAKKRIKNVKCKNQNGK